MMLAFRQRSNRNLESLEAKDGSHFSQQSAVSEPDLVDNFF